MEEVEEEENGEKRLNGWGVLLWSDGNVLEWDRELHKIFNELNATESSGLKRSLSWYVNFTSMNFFFFFNL